MTRYLAEGAQLQCSMGASPARLALLPRPFALRVGGAAVASVNDTAPMVNVPSFGACRSPSNPQVAAATAAAMGVLTPMPCVPATSGPWTPGARRAKVQGAAAAMESAQCTCAWAGTITVVDPAQARLVEG